jgi:acetate kinase
MRTLLSEEANGNQKAHLAIEVFCYRLARHLLALTAGLDRVDGLIFTGGIGENAAVIRERTLSYLRLLNPVLDQTLNAVHGAGASGRITTIDSPLLVLVLPTNEELVIAKETANLMKDLS